MITRAAIDKAREMIARWEGFSPTVYDDVGGLPTIGFGHLLLPGEQFDEITREEALALLEADMTDAIECVDQHVDVELTDDMQAALVSFVYNVGCGHFRGSTLLKLLNEERYADAAKQFARWNRAGGEVVAGLVNRRAAEAELFRGEV